MRVMISGSNGLLGGTLVSRCYDRGIPSEPYRRSEEVNSEALSERLISQRVSVFVHCAANTNVELCEKEPEQSYRDIVELTEKLAIACSIAKVRFVFISSTGVYGKGQAEPYTETDETVPTTAHHSHKLQAERIVLDLMPDSLIVRTGWLFGGCVDNPKNFVVNRIKEARQTAMTGKKMLSDKGQFGCPTYASDVADTLLELIGRNESGLFNCVNQGRASRFEYVQEIVKLSGVHVSVDPVPSSYFRRLAKVSFNETALNHRLIELNIGNLANWKDSLAKYISALDMN